MADGVGALLGYDILCRSSGGGGPTHRRGSGSTLVEASHSDCAQPAAAAGGCTGQHPGAADVVVDQFEFDVSEFFMLGSPVALVLAYRQLCSEQHYAGQLTIYHCTRRRRKKTALWPPLVMKGTIVLLPVTLPNVDRFSSFFHSRTLL